SFCTELPSGKASKFRGKTSTHDFVRRRRDITFPWKKCERNCRNAMVWTRSRNRCYWARLLISLRRMLASRQRKNPLLKKKNHECFQRKSLPGIDSDGCGADWPGRAQLRYLFATVEGPNRLYRNADGRSHRQSRHCPVAVFANGGLEKGHKHLYQFARRIGHGRPGGLRHDAVSNV